MFKVESKRIGVHDYKVTQLDAVTGRRVFTRLVKLIGPSLAKLEGGGEAKLGAALAELLGQLDEQSVDYFCDTFGAVTEVSGGQYGKAAPQLDTVFVTHFAGEYLAMTQWLIFCMKVNFSSFFAGAGLLVGQLAASGSSSPTT